MLCLRGAYGVIGDKRIPSMLYVRPKTENDGHAWRRYVYDEHYDCVICPEYHILHYTTTNRNGYREHKSRFYICETCPTRERCTQNAKREKTITRHIWQDYLELAEGDRYTPEYRAIYERRKETIERCFADKLGIHQ